MSPLAWATVLLMLVACGRAARQEPATSQAAHPHEILDGFRRSLAQATSNDAPGPFPQPDVAVGSPYTDQQQLVLDTQDIPFASVGQLLIAGDSGGGQCTGSLIEPGVVLTAAHCWYEDGEAQTSAYFTPGYSAAVIPRRPFGNAEVVSVKMPTAFVNCPSSSRSYSSCEGLGDFALFFLNRTFDTVDTISYGYDTSIPETQTVYTAGYPGDKCNSDANYFGQCPMWYTACPMTNYDEADVFESTACFSGPGQSGSPVWISTEPGKALQIAVLTSTPANDQRIAYSGETPTLNLVITPSRYDFIRRLIASGPNGSDADATLFQASSPSKR